MENQNTLSTDDKIKDLVSVNKNLTSRNEHLQKLIDENRRDQVRKIELMAELFTPVMQQFNFLDEYEVRDIAEEAAREAVDDFEIDNHLDVIRRDVLDNIDLNDYAETIRDICGLNDPVDEREAPNYLDDIRDIIKEELSGAYIQGQIKLSDE
jgi:hypothetical protein